MGEHGGKEGGKTVVGTQCKRDNALLKIIKYQKYDAITIIILVIIKQTIISGSFGSIQC